MNTSVLDKHYKILNSIKKNDGITITGIHVETKLNIRTIQRHIKFMLKNSIVTKKSENQKAYYLNITPSSSQIGNPETY